MLGQREALPSDLYMKCKFFEEEGGDLPLSELHSHSEEEEGESHRNPMVIPRGLYRVVPLSQHQHVD